MNIARPFTELIVLAALAASASPKTPPSFGRTALLGMSRLLVPDAPDLGLLNRTVLAERIRSATTPAGEAYRNVPSKSLGEFSGGPTGTLLVVAALIAAVALILAVVIPWQI